MHSPPSLHYRELRGYRYVVAEVFSVAMPELVCLSIEHPRFRLAAGVLSVQPGYAWDGVSGPAANTPATRVPGLVHDVCYQLIRGGLLSPDHRVTADWILYRLMRASQRPWAEACRTRRGRALALCWIELRAFLYFAAVRFGGRRHIRPRKVEPQDQIFVV